MAGDGNLYGTTQKATPFITNIFCIDCTKDVKLNILRGLDFEFIWSSCYDLFQGPIIIVQVMQNQKTLVIEVFHRNWFIPQGL